MNKVGTLMENVRSTAHGFMESLPKPVRDVLSWILNQVVGSAKF